MRMWKSRWTLLDTRDNSHQYTSILHTSAGSRPLTTVTPPCPPATDLCPTYCSPAGSRPLSKVTILLPSCTLLNFITVDRLTTAEPGPCSHQICPPVSSSRPCPKNILVFTKVFTRLRPKSKVPNSFPPVFRITSRSYPCLRMRTDIY